MTTLAAWSGIALPFLITLAIVVLVPRSTRLMVTRGAERTRAVLHARLVRSHRELPGRPPAAGTARRVYQITDLPAADGARASEGN